MATEPTGRVLDRAIDRMLFGRLLPGKELPHYSTDLTAAMQLAEKLTDRFHWHIHSPFRQGDKWFAGLSPLGVTGWNGRPDYEVVADTLPEAIALTAFYALQDVKDDDGDAS